MNIADSTRPLRFFSLCMIALAAWIVVQPLEVHAGSADVFLPFGKDRVVTVSRTFPNSNPPSVRTCMYLRAGACYVLTAFPIDKDKYSEPGFSLDLEKLDGGTPSPSIPTSYIGAGSDLPYDSENDTSQNDNAISIGPVPTSGMYCVNGANASTLIPQSGAQTGQLNFCAAKKSRRWTC